MTPSECRIRASAKRAKAKESRKTAAQIAAMLGGEHAVDQLAAADRCDDAAARWDALADDPPAARASALRSGALPLWMF